VSTSERLDLPAGRDGASSPGEPAEPTGDSWLRRRFFVPTAAVNLGVLRVAVFGALLIETLVSHAAEFSRLPDGMITSVPQIGPLLVALPRSSTVVTAAVWLMVAACVAAAVGWRTRVATVTAALLGLYVLGIPELYGKVDHYHHLVWLAVLLACAPCGDALGLDARRKPRPERSVRYGFPLRIAWVLIGACYLFPGIAKLSEWRIWLDPHNLRGLLWVQQWAAHGGISPPGWTLGAMAAGTVVFEIGFVFAVFSRRLRPWAIVLGLSFHAATYLTMRISFWSLMICYVAFVDWSRRDAPVDRREPARTTAVAAVVLVVGVGLTGIAALVNAWPFACYPTFTGDYRHATISVTTEVVAVDHGRTTPIDLLPWLPASRRPAVLQHALEHHADLAELGREAEPGAGTIQVWRITESVRPGHRGEMLDRELVAEVRE
jgi:HTTM domain